MQQIDLFKKLISVHILSNNKKFNQYNSVAWVDRSYPQGYPQI